MNKCLIYCTSVNIFSCSGRVQELQLQERLQEPPDSPSTSPTANPTYTPTTTTTLGKGPKIKNKKRESMVFDQQGGGVTQSQIIIQI